MKKNFVRLALISMKTLFACGLASAQTVKFQQGVDGYSGTVDIEIVGGKIPLDAILKSPKPSNRTAGVGPGGPVGDSAKRPSNASTEGSPSTKVLDESKSTAPEITVDIDNGGKQSQALIRFDNIIGEGAGKIPKGATITAATLTLHVGGAGGDRALVHRMLSAWDEKLTWETAKLAGNSDGGLQADNKEMAAPFNTIDETKEGFIEVNVLPLVNLWVSGEQPNYGLALTSDSTNGWDFDSSESKTVERRPLLTVTYVLTDSK